MQTTAQTNDSGHVAGGKTEGDTRAHTATPWFYQENSDVYTHIVRPEHSKGMIVVQLSQDKSGQSEADARFIVRAVNAHDDLVTALKRARDDLEDTAVLVKQGLAQRENILRSIEIKVSAASAALRKAGANN